MCSTLKHYLTVAEEQMCVVDAEGIVATQVNLQTSKVVVQLEDGHLGRDQFHVLAKETTTLLPVN